MQLWQQGGARVLLNSSIGIDEHPTGAAVAALGVETADPAGAAAAPRRCWRRCCLALKGPAEADLAAVAAPDGTSVFFCRTGAGRRDQLARRTSRRPVRITGATVTASRGITDRSVALTQPFDRFDEAALFYRTVLGLQTQHNSEIAAPFGLVRNRAVADPTDPCGCA